ncbi:MAG: hypothetical protein AB1589_39695 [Cyanobacteriota bacterium]
MLQRTSIRYRLFSISCAASSLLSMTFLVMWLFSYSFYTSLGVDSDRADASDVITAYYRIRWPGNGSFWIGGGTYRHPGEGKRLDPFDLGGVFFQAPQRPQPHSFWNRIGFWLIPIILEDGTNGSIESTPSQWQFWIGVPSWLPMLLTGALPIRAWIWHQRNR